MSQLKLANLSGVNRSHIGSIESTKVGTIDTPRYETIVKLAEGLGVFPVDLIEPTGKTIMEMPADYRVAEGNESTELLQFFDRLADDDRQRLVAIARALYELSRA